MSTETSSSADSIPKSILPAYWMPRHVSIRGKKFLVDNVGLVVDREPGEEPDICQIAACVRFLKKARRTQSFNATTAYSSKRCVEFESRQYIPNGAMLLAAAHVGIKMRKCDRINAQLAISSNWIWRQREAMGAF